MKTHIKECMFYQALESVDVVVTGPWNTLHLRYD